MSKDKLYNNTDELLRSKFDDAAETPPSFVWENIEQKLNSPKKKRRPLFWFLPLLLLLTTVIWIKKMDKKNNHNSAKNTNTNNSNVTNNKSSTNNINAEVKSNKLQEKSALYSKQLTRINELNDTNASIKKNLNKQKERVQTKNDKTTSGKEAIAKNLFVNKKSLLEKESKLIIQIHTKKSVVKNMLVKSKTTNYASQKSIVSDNRFSFSKSYIDIAILKKDIESKASREDAIFFVIKKNEDVKEAKNMDVIIDTIIKDTMKVIAKTVDTITIRKEETKTKNKKLLDKYLSFYIIPNTSNSSFASTNTSYDFLNEKGKLSISFGASYNFAISKNLVISAGISYDRLKYNLSSTSITFSRFITQPYTFHTAIGDIAVDAATMKDGFNPPLPNFPTQFKINYDYEYSLHFLNVPIEFQYKLINNKIKVSINSGITTQFLIAQNATLSLLKEKMINVVTYKNFDLNKTNFAATVGFMIEFPSKNKWHFYFTPSSRFLLSSLNKNALVDTKASSFGCSIGAALKL